MDITQIISKSRIQTNTSSAQKTDQQMLNDLNIIQDNIFSQLGTVNKLYAWTYWNTDTVAGQEEYKLPVEDIQNNYPWLKRLLKVYIDYGNWYQKAQIYSDPQDFKAHIWWVSGQPIVMQADWSLFFNPAPKQAIIWGIKVEWTYRPLPLLITDTTEDIKLAPEYHDVYLMWLNKMNYEDKQLFNEAQLWDNKFILKMREIIEQWWQDVDWPYTVWLWKVVSLTNNLLP